MEGLPALSLQSPYAPTASVRPSHSDCRSLHEGDARAASLRVRVGNVFQAESGKFVRDLYDRELDYALTLGPECTRYRVE